MFFCVVSRLESSFPCVLKPQFLPLSKSSRIPSFHNVLGSRIWYQTNTKIGVTQTRALTVGAPLPVSAFVAMLVSLKMGSQALFKEHVLLSQLLPCDSVGLTVGVCALPKNIVYFRRVQDKKTTSTSPGIKQVQWLSQFATADHIPTWPQFSPNTGFCQARPMSFLHNFCRAVVYLGSPGSMWLNPKGTMLLQCSCIPEYWLPRSVCCAMSRHATCTRT